MNGIDERSLLSFLDAAVVVVDPDGRVVYANPAFERRFGETATPGELAAVFAGGAREAVLAALAEVCRGGSTARFRVREGGVGYHAVASPIEAVSDRVGVIISLDEEPAQRDDQLLAIHCEGAESLSVANDALEMAARALGSDGAPAAAASAIERAREALERATKWNEQARAALRGRTASLTQRSAVDLSTLIRHIAKRSAAKFENAGVRFDLLAPARLPSVLAEPERLEMVLMHLLYERLAATKSGGVLTLSARTATRGRRVVISVVDSRATCEEESLAPECSVPPMVAEIIADLGGRSVALRDPHLGCAVLVELESA